MVRSRWWLGVGGLFLAAIAFYAGSQWARRAKGTLLYTPVRVVDRRGDLVAELDTGPRGPFFRLTNGRERHQVVIGLGAEGGTIDLYHRDGHRVASVGASAHGGQIDLYDRADQRVATIASTGQGGRFEVREAVPGAIFAAPDSAVLRKVRPPSFLR